MSADGHRGTRAIQTMVEYAPATGGLALWMEHRDVDDRNDVPVIANDGRCVYYGPGFSRLPPEQQVGLVAHQVLHVALRHAPRQAELRGLVGEVDPELFTTCADAIVNTSLGHLSWLELPPGSVRLESLLSDHLGIRRDPTAALLEWDVESLYRRVDDRKARKARTGSGRTQGEKGATGDGEGKTPRPAPTQDGPVARGVREAGRGAPRDLLAPDPDTVRPEGAAEQAREWAERVTRAHAGDGEFSMLRGLLADLPRVRTPWETVLRTRLARGLTREPERSWSRPARSYLANRGRTAGGRRMPWEPGIVSSRKVPRLVVVVDVSGSVDDALLERFATEVEAITRRMNAQLVLVVGDHKVRAVEAFEPGVSSLREVEFQGGGGTDFTPLLEEATRHRPDLCVVLSDLWGPALHRPPYPVLWAVPPHAAHVQEPFGRKLVLAD